MQSEYQRFRIGVAYSLTFILLLWSVEALEQAFSFDFRDFGILPRTLSGTVGIITGPLVHGDIYHLISNTFPLIILGIGVFYFYRSIAFEVIFLIYVLTGICVWVVAREAYHIGASGLVYGLLSFLFFSGIFRKDPRTMAVSLTLFFIYGTNMIYGIFPVENGISWESHLIGALIGLVCAIYFRHERSSIHPILTEVKVNKDQMSSTLPESTFLYQINTEEDSSQDSSDKINIKVDPNELV